jgi:formate-dependent nitrite reductase membrane component NrfD
VLALFGSSSGAAGFVQLVERKFDIGPIRVLGNLAEGFSAALGLPLATYTGVLIGATAIPAWNHNIKTLPIHFGMSRLGSGASVLELVGSDDSPALNLLAMGASAVESYEGFQLEFMRDPEVNRPLKQGLTGWITRFGGVLSGPIPLALRLIATVSGARRMRRLAAWSSIAGSILTRYGWIYAGHVSARDWRLLMFRVGANRRQCEANGSEQRCHSVLCRLAEHRMRR